jgi:hypothetical protein
MIYLFKKAVKPREQILSQYRKSEANRKRMITCQDHPRSQG